MDYCERREVDELMDEVKSPSDQCLQSAPVVRAAAAMEAAVAAPRRLTLASLLRIVAPAAPATSETR